MILLSTIQQINSKFQDKTVNILDERESDCNGNAFEPIEWQHSPLD